MKSSLALVLGLTLYFAPVLACHAGDFDHYSEIAATLSEPSFTGESDDDAMARFADGNIIRRVEFQRQRLDSFSGLAGAERDAVSAVEEDLFACYSTYDEIRRLDSTAPDVVGAVSDALKAAPAVAKSWNHESLTSSDKDAVNTAVSKMMWEAGAAIYNAYSLKQQQKQYKADYSRARHRAYDEMLKLDTAGRYDNAPSALLGKGLWITVHPSLAGTYSFDIIDIRNDTGKDLTSCSLFVQLKGIFRQSGKACDDQHFHYIGAWKAGTTRHFWYPSVSYDGIAADQSVDVIRSVNDSLDCDQVRFNWLMDYPVSSYDADVKAWAEEHLKGDSFNGKWNRFNSNIFEEDGFEVTYDGDLSSFVLNRVTITATSGSWCKKVYSDERIWSKGYENKKIIEHRDFNEHRPSEVEMSISFPGSTYRRELTFTIPPTSE